MRMSDWIQTCALPILSLDRKFTLAEMRRITLEANAPLGREYIEPLSYGTSQRWMDPFPRQGKSAGAYLFGAAYDVHPYLLLNLSDDYNGLTTYSTSDARRVVQYCFRPCKFRRW